MDVSWSQDLFTDPPQYTSYARNAVVFGEWNPLNDDRLVFFQKNITGLVTYLVFLITGPSVAMGQLVAVLLNIIAIGLLAWGAGRAFGFVAGCATALMLAMNYLVVSYGRLPFLEVAANACLAGAFLALMAAERRWWLVIVAGIAAGIGTFFGKVTALHAVPVFFLTAALLGWQAQGDAKARRWARPVGFAAGFAVVFVSWYIYAYRPASAEVLAYLKEQSLSLYGAPVGLSSLSGFLSQWFTFGLNNDLLVWDPVVSILGLLGMGYFLIRHLTGDSLKGLISHLPPAGFALVGWFWSAWAAFMPFNYRPVRYQIVLLFPLAACAGWLVGQVGKGAESPLKTRRTGPSWYLLLPLTLILATGIQHLVFMRLFDPRGATTLRDSVVLALLFSLIIAAVWLAIARRDRPSGSGPVRRSTRTIEILLGLALVVMLVNQGRHFERWWSARLHTLEHANADLEKILGGSAILSGGYGTALTQSQRLGNFPAMFGVSEVDHDFFRKYPITHVAEVDQQDQPFFRNYPDIAKGAEPVTTYFIRNMPIAIYRVSAVGGNPDASAYRPSDFERMRSSCKDRPRDSVLSFLPTWVEDSADFYSGWRWLGDLYYNSDRLEDARAAYSRAAETFADDFSLWALIGDVSWEIFRQGAGGEDRQQAIDAWTRAASLNPRNPQLAERMNRAYGR